MEYMKQCKNCQFIIKGMGKTGYCRSCFNRLERKYVIGRKTSEETKEKIRITKIAEKNPNWKGDKVGKTQLHAWILRRKPRPRFCENCKIGFPIDLANISQKYKRDVNDFEWLCRKCHMSKDGRLKNLLNFPKKTGNKSPMWKGGKPKCLICGKITSTYKSKWCRKHCQTHRKVLPTLCLNCETKINHKSRLCRKCYFKNRNSDGTFKRK